MLVLVLVAVVSGVAFAGVVGVVCDDGVGVIAVVCNGGVGVVAAACHGGVGVVAVVCDGGVSVAEGVVGVVCNAGVSFFRSCHFCSCCGPDGQERMKAGFEVLVVQRRDG